MKAHELLADESKWTTGSYARKANGAPVHFDSPEAVCWCAAGAIWKCSGTTKRYSQAMAKARKITERDYPGRFLEGVNDNIGYEAVLKVLREADV